MATPPLGLQRHQAHFRKRRGVHNSTGNKVPWKTGTLIYLPVTSRPLIFLQKEAVLSPWNFAASHLTAFILDFYLPLPSRPMKRRTLSQRPTFLNHCRHESFTYPVVRGLQLQLSGVCPTICITVTVCRMQSQALFDAPKCL